MREIKCFIFCKIKREYTSIDIIDVHLSKLSLCNIYTSTHCYSEVKWIHIGIHCYNVLQKRSYDRACLLITVCHKCFMNKLLLFKIIHEKI